MFGKIGWLLIGFGIGLMLSPNPKGSLLFIIGIIAVIVGILLIVMKKDKLAKSES